MKKIFLFLLSLLPLSAAVAQVSLAPTAVYIDKNGIGTLYVTNNSETAQEITINFQFGYSSNDKNGVLIMVYDDSAKAKTHGLDKMVKAFPRTFNLPPKQQQLVRLQVRAPKDLPEGTYFTRIKVGSSGQVADVGAGGAAPEAISTLVNVRFEQVIVAFFKKGKVNTGINIDKVNTTVDSTYMKLAIDYRTLGNSPFLGKVKYTLRGPDGNLLLDASQTIAMYFEGTRVSVFQLSEKPKPGRYVLEIKYETQRSDIAAEDLIQAPPYVYKTNIQLP